MSLFHVVHVDEVLDERGLPGDVGLSPWHRNLPPPPCRSPPSIEAFHPPAVESESKRGFWNTEEGRDGKRERINTHNPVSLVSQG